MPPMPPAVNVPGLMLGKGPKREDSRNLMLANYLPPKLPVIPGIVEWTRHVPKPDPMFGNDSNPDCTAATIGHLIRTMTANAGSTLTLSDSAIFRFYAKLDPTWDPTVPGSGQGAVVLDVLKLWKNEGIVDDAGRVHKIAGFVEIDPKNRVHIRAAIWLFGGVYGGFGLPLTASDQINAGKPWTVDTSNPSRALRGSWGGHAMPIVDFLPLALPAVGIGTAKRPLKLVTHARSGRRLMTWAQRQAASQDWCEEYGDEAYAVFDSLDWLKSDGFAPCGFDAAALIADLQAVH